VPHLVIHGLWGVREESPRRVAERWVAFLGALEALDPGIRHWYDCGRADGGGSERRSEGAEGVRAGGQASGPGPELDCASGSVPLTVSAVRAFLCRENPEPDADSIGYSACLSSSPSTVPVPGGSADSGGGALAPGVSVRIRAGGSSEFVHGVCAVTLAGPSAEAPRPPLVQHTAEVLRALADSWDIDSGHVYTVPQLDFLRQEFGLHDADPFCGRSIYLSANRAALVPRSLPGTLLPTDSGGLVVDLAKGADDPDTETLLETNRALRAAGALDRLLVPLDRALW
jgi:hypothetical protein